MEAPAAGRGDKIYIIAGYGEKGKRNKNTVEVYDSKTDKWADAPALPVALNHEQPLLIMEKFTLLVDILTTKFHQINCLYMIPF